MPWFDRITAPESDQIAAESNALERFSKSGLHNSFKLGLAKILWIKQQNPDALKHAVWLSAAGYIAYRLTGKMAVDYTLAARTYAFGIDNKSWDTDWIRHFGLNPSIFPEAVQSGAIIGHVLAENQGIGLAEGIPVAISGHDHVCAALAVGAVAPGVVYDSMGTAETLVGTMPEQKLGKREFDAGISFGCHVAKDRYFWMGGNSSSGGSIEWLRQQLSEPALSYEELANLLSKAKRGPTGILYYPYLTGSGAPQPDPKVKAALIGFTKEHGRGEIIQSVLEGTAYQLESIRREAEQIVGQRINKLIVVGGGTQNPYWLQIKADVSNCVLELPPLAQATMLGAAMAAAIDCGVYASAEEAAKAVQTDEQRVVEPDANQHAAYRSLYENGFVSLQQPLRQFYRAELEL